MICNCICYLQLNLVPGYDGLFSPKHVAIWSAETRVVFGLKMLSSIEIAGAARRSIDQHDSPVVEQSGYRLEGNW
jgi:hypothetical protein